MKNEPTALGLRIQALREEAGLSKAHVARVCGVSDVSVGYWENGTIQGIGHTHLVPLAGLFGLTVSELLDDPALTTHQATVVAASLRHHARRVVEAPGPMQDAEGFAAWLHGKAEAMEAAVSS